MKKFFTEVVVLTKSYNIFDFKDWLDYHLNELKFDHCHVFDNESFVDVEKLCSSFQEKITYEKIIGWPNQYALYNRYLNNETRAEWVLTIDDDEFLWMKNFKHVNDMIYHYQQKWPDMVKLSVRWKSMFPNNPNEERKTSLMDFCKNDNEKLADLFPGGNKPVKTFVKTDSKIEFSILKQNQTHNPIVDGKPSYMCNGEKFFGNWFYGPYTDNELRLLHYQYKSKKEWEWKCLNRISASDKTTYKKFINIPEKMMLIEKNEQ